MALRETFNAGKGAVVGQLEMGAGPLDPYASNVHLIGLNAIQLAGLELAGVILPRLTGGAAGLIGPDGRRQKADGGVAQETAILQAVNAAAQARQQWDAQLVSVGGTMMSNAEIQLALRNIIDSPDRYAQYAVAEGLIEEGQEQAFAEAAAELYDLREKEGNGDLTAAEQEAFQALQESVLGKAVMEAMPISHADTAFSVNASADQSKTLDGNRNEEARGPVVVEDFVSAAFSAAIDDMPFAHVPPLMSAFAAGLEATEPLDRPSLKPDDETRPAVPDSEIVASGFDF